MDKLHSIIGASSAKRWFNCPGSVQEIKKYPTPPQSEYAEEGTKAHDLAEQILLGNPFVCDDEEMLGHVRLYVETVREDQEMLGGEIVVEQQFALPQLHPNLWGTNDAALITEVGVLIVYDFKYGKGVVVEVVDNEQLMIYGLGALSKYKAKGYVFQTIEIVIVQPRAYHEDGVVRRQKFDVTQLEAFAEVLAKKAHATDDTNAKLSAGEWCKFCPAQPGCPALKKKIEETAMVAFDDAIPTLPTPATIDEAKLVKLLHFIPVLDDWISSVKSFALEKARRGEMIPGFKLVRGRTHRKWKDEGLTYNALLRSGLSEADIMEEPKLKSPAVIEKLTKLGKPKQRKEIVEPLVVQPEGALNLVPEDDSRPSIDSTAGAQNAFPDL